MFADNATLATHPHTHAPSIVAVESLLSTTCTDVGFISLQIVLGQDPNTPLVITVDNYELTAYYLPWVYYQGQRSQRQLKHLPAWFGDQLPSSSHEVYAVMQTVTWAMISSATCQLLQPASGPEMLGCTIELWPRRPPVSNIACSRRWPRLQCTSYITNCSACRRLQRKFRVLLRQSNYRTRVGGTIVSGPCSPTLIPWDLGCLVKTRAPCVTCRRPRAIATPVTPVTSLSLHACHKCLN